MTIVLPAAVTSGMIANSSQRRWAWLASPAQISPSIARTLTGSDDEGPVSAANGSPSRPGSTPPAAAAMIPATASAAATSRGPRPPCRRTATKPAMSTASPSPAHAPAASSTPAEPRLCTACAADIPGEAGSPASAGPRSSTVPPPTRRRRFAMAASSPWKSSGPATTSAEVRSPARINVTSCSCAARRSKPSSPGARSRMTSAT